MSRVVDVSDGEDEIIPDVTEEQNEMFVPTRIQVVVYASSFCWRVFEGLCF